ncbi:MAG: SGNH/GDSL hydrolase family protein [Acidobacteria bacterium]|nr:SGNH/GDSL hydrolase family protein [Acidobacteriota bacterium]
MKRRCFVGAVGAGAIAFGQEAKPELHWTSVLDLGVEGKGWKDTAHPFDRLPAKAQTIVRGPVWSLSHDSAGMAVRFTSAAPRLSARWKVRRERLALPHMPATGVSGLDLYVKHNGRWRWMANGRPEKQENEQVLFQNYSGPARDYMLYLPLYNGVEFVQLGVDKDAGVKAAAPRARGRKPIVFYGSSILQGGCASRPGMAYPAILGRMLEWETINLGFSGNGMSEPEFGVLQAELDAQVYVYDSLPNMQPEMVAERTETFLKTLRKAHPSMWIVCVENALYTNLDFNAANKARVLEKNRMLKGIYERMADRRMAYIGAEKLYGDDGEATVDGTHPTDVGFMRMAETIAPVLRPLLG